MRDCFSVLARDFASFHIVLRGRCVLEVDAAPESLALRQGQFVVLPRGNAHVVRDSPSSPVTLLEQLIAGSPLDARGTLRRRGRGEQTVLACGAFYFENPRTVPIAQALPPVLHVQTRGRAVARWLRTLTEYLAAESKAGQPGASTIVCRLADILFIEAIRAVRWIRAFDASKSAGRASRSDAAVRAAPPGVERAAGRIDVDHERRVIGRNRFALASFAIDFGPGHALGKRRRHE
jgi:hypothetical protein